MTQQTKKQDVGILFDNNPQGCVAYVVDAADSRVALHETARSINQDVACAAATRWIDENGGNILLTKPHPSLNLGAWHAKRPKASISGRSGAKTLPI